MHKYLEKTGEATFEKIFNQKLGKREMEFLLDVGYLLSLVCQFWVPFIMGNAWIPLAL